MRRGKLTLIDIPYIPYHIGLTAINFVHVNDRSLYIADWRMVVVEGKKGPTTCKRKGVNIRGVLMYVWGGNMSRGNVRIPKTK